MKYISAIVLFIAMSSSAQAELWMPSIFGNGMVLQSGMPVPVRGEADPGAEVTVEFAGQKKSAVADVSKHWKIILDPMPASSEPRPLTVQSSIGNQQSEIGNVLVGEVWILSGQSNMGWTLKNCDGGPAAAAAADYPWMKIFKQWPNQGACDEPARDVKGGQWVTCTPTEAANLSGVGFFFARELQKSLPRGTPIALINTQMGATYAECWIDFQTLERTPSARPFLDKAAKEVRSGESDPKGFWGENNFRRPAALYNGKVAPIQPFAARGVIWYQGEGNAQRWLAPGYAETLAALINGWRRGFEDPELPFIVVQLPRYNAGPGSDWPAIRAAQAQVARDLPHVELAVTIDCGSEHQIHPPDKEPVGQRLAQLARAKVYGEAVVCGGSFFQSLEISNGVALVTFSNSDGLHLKGGEGFEICGADGTFVPAEADVLTDGRVNVSSPQVAAPAAVRYAWFNWGEVCLFNGLGLPAAPFTARK
jgi:sialate O-acetylesterase